MSTVKQLKAKNIEEVYDTEDSQARADITTAQNNIETLQGNTQTLQNNVKTLQDSTKNITNNIGTIQNDIMNINDNIRTLSNKVIEIKNVNGVLQIKTGTNSEWTTLVDIPVIVKNSSSSSGSGSSGGSSNPDTSTDTDVDITTGLLFNLPQSAKFSAANEDFYDTNVQLLKTDTSWSIFIDFQGSALNTNQSNTHTLFHCMTEYGQYPGICFQIWTSNYGINVYNTKTSSTNGTLAYNNTDNKKLIITKAQGDNNFYLYGLYTGKLTIDSFTPVSQTLVLGACQDKYGNYCRYWNGTINQFKIYDRVLNTQQINKLLGA